MLSCTTRHERKIECVGGPDCSVKLSIPHIMSAIVNLERDRDKEEQVKPRLHRKIPISHGRQVSPREFVRSMLIFPFHAKVLIANIALPT